MGKWLAATCKGLSVAAGPLGAIGEFALKIYDDERADERDVELKKLIVRGQDISKEILEEVFELKSDLRAVREQFINGLGSIGILLQSKEGSVTTPEELEALFTESFVVENDQLFQQSRFVTQKQLKHELVKLYGHGTSFERFLVLVEEAGFDTASLPSSSSRDVIIFQFLKEIERRTMAEKEKIFSNLAGDAPGSSILILMRSLIREQIQILLNLEEGKRSDSYEDTGRGRDQKVKIELTLKPPLAGILFFDIKNYSSLNLDELNTYHEYVAKKLHHIVVNKDGKEIDDYLYKNSWGDGIVLIHSDYLRLVSVGLQMRDYFKNRKYQRITDELGNERLELGNKDMLPRIAIHFGEFRQCDDGFKGGPICYGPTLFLPARIEPITPAGRVWVTYRVKDFIEDKQKQQPGGRQILFFEQGWRKLAKEFGEEKIYEATWKDDPEPLRLQDEVDSEAYEQDPEDFEEISDNGAKRITALTGLDPKRVKVSVCSREPTDDKCPVKGKSIHVISEIGRNGKAASEELEVGNLCSLIDRDVAEILDNYRHSKPVTYYPLKHLYDDITVFLECVRNIKHDRTWPDFARKREVRPQKYLDWRIKDFRVNEENMGATFITMAEQFQTFFKKTFPKNETLNYERRIPIDRITEHAFDYLHMTAAYLGPHLQDIGKRRISGSKKALRDGFKDFSRFKFAQHLKVVTQVLANKCKGIPSVWK